MAEPLMPNIWLLFRLDDLFVIVEMVRVTETGHLGIVLLLLLGVNIHLIAHLCFGIWLGEGVLIFVANLRALRQMLDCVLARFFQPLRVVTGLDRLG